VLKIIVEILFNNVIRSAYLGSYHKSPYHFGRKWTIESVPSNLNAPSFHHIENFYLKNALDEMRNQMMYLIKMNEKTSDTSETDNDSSASEDPPERNKKRRVTRKQTAEKVGKGKGKKTKKNIDDPKNVRSFWNPFSKFPRVDNQDNQSSASSFVVLDDPINQDKSRPSTSKAAEASLNASPSLPGDGPDPEPAPTPAPTPIKTTYWLTKCQLELNSAPINQVIKTLKLWSVFQRSMVCIQGAIIT